jgi:hypothetical protein
MRQAGQLPNSECTAVGWLAARPRILQGFGNRGAPPLRAVRLCLTVDDVMMLREG